MKKTAHPTALARRAVKSELAAKTVYRTPQPTLQEQLLEHQSQFFVSALADRGRRLEALGIAMQTPNIPLSTLAELAAAAGIQLGGLIGAQ